MSRTLRASLVATLAMLVLFGTSAVAGNSLSLDPSISMSWGHIDYANKDRVDYLKFYSNSAGTDVKGVKLTLVGMSKYLTIVPRGTTRYHLVGGKKVWATNHLPARSELAHPTFTIALKVRADVPRRKLQCIKLTAEDTGTATKTVAAAGASLPLMGGKNGACWTGKQLLNPVTNS